MLSLILSACVLMAVTMWMHAAGIRRAAAQLPEIARAAADGRLAYHPDAAAHDLVADPLHLAEISVWGLFYLWRGCLPDDEWSVLL